MTQPKYPTFFSTRVREARRFYLDLQPPPRIRLAAVCGGFEHCAPNYRIQRAGLPYLALEFVAGGSGRVVLNGDAFPLSPGTIFVYGPGICHEIWTDPKRSLAKYFVDFAGQEANTLLDESELSPGSVVQTSAPSELMKILDNLIENGLKNTRFTQRICALLVEQLLLKIAETRIPFGAPKSAAFETYQRCRRYIEDHHLELGSLRQVAQECYVNPAYLCRLFKRYDHQSPYQYLLRLKMNRAAELLQHSGNQVKEVAEELNFSDPYHFSRTFRSIFGVSPRHFIGALR